MKFGIQLGVDAPSDPVALAQLVAAIEDLGFSSLWLGDHIVIPTQVSDAAHRAAVGGTQPFADRTSVPISEPLTTLSYIAGISSHINLGLAVLVLPLRNPVVAAKMLAGIDVLSGGRLHVGIGSGWIEEEFDALRTAPFRDRVAVTDEYLQLMIELWESDEPRFEGEHYQLRGVTMYPKPTSKPHPPLWMGGNGDRALRKVVAFADGWLPLFQSPSQFAEKQARLAVLCAEAGRETREIRTAVGCRFSFDDATGPDRPILTGSVAQMQEDLRRYEDVGCEEVHLVCARPGLDAHELIDDLRRFADDVVGGRLELEAPTC